VQILSHRGYWKSPAEKNSATAFTRSFELGFGTETDLRELNGRLVISHDPPLAGALLMEEFLDIYLGFPSRLPLALNIKEDGLQDALTRIIAERDISNYFCFDMSTPDMLYYYSKGLNTFTRQSDVEPEPVCYSQSNGIWMDTMFQEWIERDNIVQPLADSKLVCIVSPDLHGRPHEEFWDRLLDWDLMQEQNLMLCTDFPEAAAAKFKAK
jgi:hypothetical protein